MNADLVRQLLADDARLQAVREAAWRRTWARLLSRPIQVPDDGEAAHQETDGPPAGNLSTTSPRQCDARRGPPLAPPLASDRGAGRDAMGLRLGGSWRKSAANRQPDSS